MKYRIRPRLTEPVEAIRVGEAIRRAQYDWQMLPEWLRTAYENGQVVFGSREIHVAIIILVEEYNTFHHMDRACQWDEYLVYRDLKIHPMTADAFESMYELVPFDTDIMK